MNIKILIKKWNYHGTHNNVIVFTSNNFLERKYLLYLCKQWKLSYCIIMQSSLPTGHFAPHLAVNTDIVMCASHFIMRKK